MFFIIFTIYGNLYSQQFWIFTFPKDCFIPYSPVHCHKSIISISIGHILHWYVIYERKNDQNGYYR